MGRILLVRHGESEGNAQRVFTRSGDVPLTERGRAEARAAGALIRARFAAVRIYSSPYRRARETAEEIRGVLRRHVIRIEDDLREQSLGDLHGKPYESVLGAPDFEMLPRHEWRPPNGETLLEVQARTSRAIHRIAALHAERDVVAVTHHGSIRSLWAYASGSWDGPARIPNGAVVLLSHDGERLELPELLETPALPS